MTTTAEKLADRLRTAADLVMPGFNRDEVAAMGKDYDYLHVEIAYPAAKSLADDLLAAARILRRLQRSAEREEAGGA